MGHIKVHALAPNIGDIGGGMLVNVSGKGFRDFGDVKCRFGGATWTMPATVASPEQMRCHTPVYPIERLIHGRREVNLEVTLNGIDYTSSIASTVAFSLYDGGQVRISHLSPLGGPTAGGTRVTISGKAFEGPGRRGIRGSLPESSLSSIATSAHASCVWHRPNASCIPGVDCRFDCARVGPCRMKVPATYVDRRTLVCRSPPASLAADPGAAPAADASFSLDVTFDDHWYSNLNASWIYYDPAHFGVSYVDPLGGPTDGNTAVLVIGSGFQRSAYSPHTHLLRRTSPQALACAHHALHISI